MTTLLQCKNITRQTMLGNAIKKASNPLTRLVGLLNRAELNEGEGLWIMPCNSIHSIGMRFLFDAVFLDKHLRVVHLVEAMKPLRLSKIVGKAHTVLELPAGTVQRSQTQLGDELAFEPTLE